jgi:hypothetical protein
MQLYLAVVCLLSFACVFTNAAKEMFGTARVITNDELVKRDNHATW